MADVELEIVGLGAPGTKLQVFERVGWPGRAPQPGEAPPAGQPVTAETTFDANNIGRVNVPEQTPYFCGVFSQGKWRWCSARSGVSDISEEAARAEAAEQRLAEQIEELRENTAGATTKLIFGINSNSSKGHAAEWTGSKIWGDRSDALDVNYASSPATASTAVGVSLAAGCKFPLVIINTSDAAILGSINPDTFAAGGLALIERITGDHPTVTTYEVINEPYYKGSAPHGSYVGANATVYGLCVKALYEKVKAAGLLSKVTLLVNAFGQFNSLSNEAGQVQSGVFKQWIDDVCGTMRDPYGQCLGDSSTAYTIADSTEVGRQEAFAFTCTKTGLVQDIRIRTNSNANTGVTSVTLGIAADSAGKPGTVLGQANVAGVPVVNSWVKVTLGSAVAVTLGTKYWLVVLPLGTALSKLHYNASVASGGTGDVEGTPTGLTSIQALSAGEYEAFNQGPIGFHAGVELERPLYSEINGWVNHPYGTLGAANSEGNFNWGSTEGFRSRVSAQGAGGNGNWWLSEFGWQGESLQNANMQGFCELAQAARKAGWLTAIYAYDDGVAGWDLHGKPAGSTYKAFAASHG